MLIEFNNLETLIFALVVLFIGEIITNKYTILQRYNIPTPVTGGLIFSIIFSLLRAFTDIEIQFAEELAAILLIAFFATVGLSARASLLPEGGKLLIILIILSVIMLVIQNTIGIASAIFLGLDPLLGLLGGSVTLAGGHGTGITYADFFSEQFGLENAREIALAAATFGIVAGGLFGGPLAGILIKRHQLEPTPDDHQVPHIADLINTHREHNPIYSDGDSIDYTGLLQNIFLISLSVVIGGYLNQYLRSIGFIVPDYVPALFFGMMLVNFLEHVKFYKLRFRSLSLCSNVSLDLFLAMALMNLKLWDLIEFIGPLSLILIVQVFVTLAFVYFIVFRVIGKRYTSSVISSGVVGFGLGSTQTAVANMGAVARHHGPAPTAFLVVPLIGAFFIDISNAIVIQAFLYLPVFPALG